jgi:hypothetical protein
MKCSEVFNVTGQNIFLLLSTTSEKEIKKNLCKKSVWDIIIVVKMVLLTLSHKNALWYKGQSNVTFFYLYCKMFIQNDASSQQNTDSVHDITITSCVTTVNSNRNESSSTYLVNIPFIYRASGESSGSFSALEVSLRLIITGFITAPFSVVLLHSHTCCKK